MSSSGTLSASGDYAKVLQAKNANESVFNVDSGSKWDASWSDGDKAGMKKLLENYGDLAYQLGDAVGAPWVAIIVQMKYEDPMSCCGANNFWGNGCDANHSSYCGASTIQGKNLGEGFVQYGETLSSDWCSSVRGISDPKEYLEKLGPLWVQGDPNGAGYTSIEYMKDSIDSLQSYIDSSEGQAIVKTFGNYSGSSSSSSSSSSLSSNSESSQSISGDDIIWIGDSDSSTAGEALLEETFPGIKKGGYGPTFNTPTSYIQSCKFIDQDGCGSQPNDSGLEILKRIINEGKMRKYLVFALGGNGGWEQSTMDKFLNLVGEDTKIVLTTTKYRKGDYTESNNLVKKIAEEHSNIYVADIAANYKDEYIDSSDIEFTEEGSKMFVQTIKDALLSAGGSCIDGGTIAVKAKELAWPEDNADKAKSNPTTSFTEASEDVGTDGTDDCLTFVKTVILSSGADVSSELTSDSTKKEIGFTEYLKGSGKWKEITADKTSDLKPGDILVSAVEGVGYNHTFVYLGNNEVASANKGVHYGRIGSLENEWCSE